jgi:serine/threonine protein kinase
MVGKTTSHWQILEKVGEGGTVYKATHTCLDRYVALKVLPSETFTDGYCAKWLTHSP